MRQNRKAGVTLFAMNKITQDMHFKQVVIEYSFEYGVTKAAIRADKTYTVGAKSTMVPFVRLQIALDDHTVIQTSTQKMR